jgi:hypothetical protein
MGLRDRLAKRVFGKEFDRLQKATDWFVSDYQQSHLMTMEQREMVEQLSEIDPGMWDLLLRQIKAMEPSAEISDQARLTIVKDCRSLYVWDPITEFIIDLWTDYAYGLHPGITPRDEGAVELWEAFWKRKENRPLLDTRRLQKMSTELLNAGEFYLVKFTDKNSGDATLRMVLTEEIKEIITKTGDAATILYYRREYTDNDGDHSVYYKDKDANKEDLETATLPTDAKIEGTETTEVAMTQIAYKVYGKHGFPLMTAGAPYSRAYRNFIQDRMAVAKSAAAYVEKATIKGSSRAVDAVKQKLESSLVSTSGSGGRDTNPPPAAGALWLQNEAINREWINKATGAVDAEKDGNLALAQAGLAGKVYPHYLGKGEAFRLATASAMEVPVLRAFQRYQSFWAAVWMDVVEWVLRDYETFGNKSFSTLEADVHMDMILSVDVNQAGTFLGQLNSAASSGLIDKGKATGAAEEIITYVLQALGSEHSQDIMADVEGDEEDNEPMTPEQTQELIALGKEWGLMETEYTQAHYYTALKSAVYGLWNGTFTLPDFRDAVEANMNRGLTQAYYRGANEFGVKPDEFTDREKAELSQYIMGQSSYIVGWGQSIQEGNKESKTLLSSHYPRLEQWASRYYEVFNMARLSVGGDIKMQWSLGATEEHCGDCSYYNGKIKRASMWKELGIAPKSKELGCKGFNCDCSLDPTTERATAGSLRKPTGT